MFFSKQQREYFFQDLKRTSQKFQHLSEERQGHAKFHHITSCKLQLDQGLESIKGNFFHYIFQTKEEQQSHPEFHRVASYKPQLDQGLEEF